MVRYAIVCSENTFWIVNHPPAKELSSYYEVYKVVELSGDTDLDVFRRQDVLGCKDDCCYIKIEK